MQVVQADRARERDRLVVGALVQLGIADQREHARLGPTLRAQPERHPDGKAQTMAERAAADLDTGYQCPVGVMAER